VVEGKIHQSSPQLQWLVALSVHHSSHWLIVGFFLFSSAEAVWLSFVNIFVLLFGFGVSSLPHLVLGRPFWC